MVPEGTWTACTVAPMMASLFVSVTLPAIVAVVTCALTVTAITNMIADKKDRILFIIIDLIN